jgi:hypothetical protein
MSRSAAIASGKDRHGNPISRTCTACAEHEPELMARCDELFTCSDCGYTFRSCLHEPGWPERPAGICEFCAWKGRLPARMLEPEPAVAP